MDNRYDDFGEDQVLDRVLVACDLDSVVASRVMQAVSETHYPTTKVESRLAELDTYRDRLTKILACPGPEQRTPEWYSARKEVVTASELLQATGTPSSKRQFLLRKCEPPGKNSIGSSPAIMHGVKFEEAACRAYAHRNGVLVHEFGLLRSERIRCFGASPDGISENGVMLEIKCPYSREICPGYVKPEYYQQMQGQMFTAELSECDFLECKFHEYQDLSEFLEDTHEDDAFGRTNRAIALNGMDKGVIATIVDRSGNRRHTYGPKNVGSSELARWIVRQSCDETTLYAITKYQCQRVRLEEDFREKTEPKILEAFRSFKEIEGNDEKIRELQAQTPPRPSFAGLQPFAFRGFENLGSDQT